jgi:hypothetical protein
MCLWNKITAWNHQTAIEVALAGWIVSIQFNTKHGVVHSDQDIMTYQDTRTGLFDFLPGLEMMNWIRWGTASVGSYEVDLMIRSIVLLRISTSFMKSIQQGPHLSKHHDLGIKLQFLTASLFQDIPRPHGIWWSPHPLWTPKAPIS